MDGRWGETGECSSATHELNAFMGFGDFLELLLKWKQLSSVFLLYNSIAIEIKYTFVLFQTVV